MPRERGIVYPKYVDNQLLVLHMKLIADAELSEEAFLQTGMFHVAIGELQWKNGKNSARFLHRISFWEHSVKIWGFS